MNDNEDDWRELVVPTTRLHLFSVMSQSSSSSSFVLGWGRRRFARMEEGCMEKATGGSFAYQPPEKRTRTKDGKTISSSWHRKKIKNEKILPAGPPNRRRPSFSILRYKQGNGLVAPFARIFRGGTL